jgi:hypothetical protein
VSLRSADHDGVSARVAITRRFRILAATPARRCG